jgi:hypothetical protein
MKGEPEKRKIWKDMSGINEALWCETGFITPRVKLTDNFQSVFWLKKFFCISLRLERDRKGITIHAAKQSVFLPVPFFCNELSVIWLKESDFLIQFLSLYLWQITCHLYYPHYYQNINP